MGAGEAVGTVVAVVPARPGGGDQAAAGPAGEAVGAGVGFIVAFFVLLPFILTVHGVPPEDDSVSSGRNGGVKFASLPVRRHSPRQRISGS